VLGRADPLSKMVRILGSVIRGICALFLAALLSTPLPVAAQALPDGQFFTESVPDRTDGAGFAVQDGHGARLWTAFQTAGGLDALGYPISRRFVLDDGLAQAFEYGVLRWDAERDEGDIVEGVKIPSDARRPEQPPLASTEIGTPIWSGWWWPASNGVEPTLFAPNSPLDKYDRYVALVSGENPATRAWELQHVFFPGSLWAGHCNGFAAAALLEPEPTEPLSTQGITFSVRTSKACWSTTTLATPRHGRLVRTANSIRPTSIACCSTGCKPPTRASC
jgi:hypothetical protein